MHENGVKKQKNILAFQQEKEFVFKENEGLDVSNMLLSVKKKLYDDEKKVSQTLIDFNQSVDPTEFMEHFIH